MDKKEMIKLAAQKESDSLRRKDFIEKLAAGGMLDSATGALKVVGVIGAALILNQFVRKIMKYLEARNLEKENPEYFKKMLERNPRLLNEDPEEVAAL